MLKINEKYRIVKKNEDNYDLEMFIKGGKPYKNKAGEGISEDKWVLVGHHGSVRAALVSYLNHYNKEMAEDSVEYQIYDYLVSSKREHQRIIEMFDIYSGGR